MHKHNNSISIFIFYLKLFFCLNFFHFFLFIFFIKRHNLLYFIYIYFSCVYINFISIYLICSSDPLMICLILCNIFQNYVKGKVCLNVCVLNHSDFYVVAFSSTICIFYVVVLVNSCGIFRKRCSKRLKRGFL